VTENHSWSRPELVDERSVGELLAELDRACRALLWDLSGDDARSLDCAWPELVAAAERLWRRIHTPPAGSTRPDIMDRLTAATHNLRADPKWRRPAQPDGRLLDLAALLDRAGELLTTHPEVDAGRPETARDIAAARMRIMHSLHLATHGIGLALTRHLEDLKRHAAEAAPGRADRSPWGAKAVEKRIKRFAVLEQLTGSYVGSRFAAVAHGEIVPRPTWGADRLAEALAQWDVLAHRFLATAAYCNRDLLQVADLQADIVAAAGAFITADRDAAGVSSDEYTRLSASLEVSQTRWRQAAHRWADLRAPAERPDPKLAVMAGNARAAIMELARDKTGWASSEVIAARVNLIELRQPLQLALGSASDIADLLCNIAENDASLTGPANAIARRFATDLDAGLIPDQIAAPVSPNAVHGHKLVDIAPVRRQLIDASRAAAESAHATFAVAACLDCQPGRPPRCLPDPWAKERLDLPAASPRTAPARPAR
jgi:hypothetical protein